MTRCLTPWLTPPPFAVPRQRHKRGGRSRLSPHRWRGSGRPVLGRNAEQRQRQMEGGDVTPPPAVFGTPPPVSASDFDCPTRCPARCHGTGAPSDSHLGGRQPDGGPDREAVNRPSRRRRGGRAVGELLQEDETIGRPCRTRRPRARVHDWPAVIAFSSRAISWRMSGSALVGPAGSAAPWPSPFRGPAFQHGRGAFRGVNTPCRRRQRARRTSAPGARPRAARGPRPTRAARYRWTGRRPRTRTSPVRSSTAIGNLNAK